MTYYDYLEYNLIKCSVAKDTKTTREQIIKAEESKYSTITTYKIVWYC